MALLGAFIDSSAGDTLQKTIRELRRHEITFAFARVLDDVREQMRLGGIEAVVGSANFYERVTNGVRAWQKQIQAVAQGNSGTSL